MFNYNSMSWTLEGNALAEYQRAVFQFLLMQNLLGTYYPENGVKLFDITIKSHALAHSAFQAKFLNPVLTWCWSGEDFMHTIKDVAQNNMSGTTTRQLSYSVTRAYCSGIHFLWTPHEQWWSAKARAQQEQGRARSSRG